MSFKRLVKILNLCHIYIPLIHLKQNNSTQLSLAPSDLLNLLKDKASYKDFVNLQTESVELIIKAFSESEDVEEDVSGFLSLLSTRFCIQKSKYALRPLESAALMTELFNLHLQFNELSLKEAFFSKLLKKHT